MKRITMLLATVLLFTTLAACTKEEEITNDSIVLTNFSGYTEDMIVEWFEYENWDRYMILYVTTEDESIDGWFAGYGGTLDVGDTATLIDIIYVQIYQYNEFDLADYFWPIEMEYDGPFLDEAYATINYLDPRGGYFEVTLKGCTDGDTATFNYPSDVYDAIESSAKSVRFLNMDTEESTTLKEEWGKPASLYTCSLLTAAQSIILQTDPDDLLGTYGRLLAWVWVQLPDEDEYFLVNYMVVKQGLAQVKYEYGAGEELSYGDYTYKEWMHIAEDYAIANELGQWSDLLDYYWDYVNNEPYYERWYTN